LVYVIKLTCNYIIWSKISTNKPNSSGINAHTEYITIALLETIPLVQYTIKELSWEFN